MAYKAKFEPKSKFQKDNCIGYMLGCKRPSTQEAVYGRARVRCCNSQNCMAFANTLAVDQGDDNPDLHLQRVRAIC